MHWSPACNLDTHAWWTCNSIVSARILHEHVGYLPRACKIREVSNVSGSRFPSKKPDGY